MNDPERVFAAGGAVEGLVKAREAGKVRHIGFTGHKSPAIHLHMLATADKTRLPFRLRADAAQRNGTPISTASSIRFFRSW